MADIIVKSGVIKKIAIGSAIIGAGIVGSFLSPTDQKNAEIIIKEKEMEMPIEYYQKITTGIADKYDLSQSELKGKLLSRDEQLWLIECWNNELQKMRQIRFKDINQKEYKNSIEYKFNQLLRE